MINTTWSEVEVDGQKMPLFVARPEAPVTRAVIVLQEIFGVNAHIQDVTKRVAELGYLAVAPDLFYRQGPRFICGYDEFDKAVPRMKAMNNDDFLKDVTQVFDFLNLKFQIKIEETATVGFCMGGRLSFLTATQRPIAGGVSFYGSRITGGPIKDTGSITCPMLLFFGGLDKNIPQSDVEKVRMAFHAHHIEAEVITYESADHGFFCNARPSFEPKSAADSWGRLVPFLAKNLL